MGPNPEGWIYTNSALSFRHRWTLKEDGTNEMEAQKYGYSSGEWKNLTDVEREKYGYPPKIKQGQ